MTPGRYVACIAVVGTAVTLSGCASVDTHATFITKTSIALLDVDSAPSGVSFGYQRTEGYLGPRLTDGSAVPVVGILHTDGNLVGRTLKQVYATGCAAEIVASDASGKGGSVPVCNASSYDDSPRPMLFATGTTLGIGFSLAEGNTPSLTLGYRRKEASSIPVNPGATPSVLASHGNDVSASTANQTPDGKVGITQYFATGRAAEALAHNPTIAGVFKQNAKDAIGVYRDHERLQSQHALTVLGCVSALRDDQLPAVWANAEALGILEAGTAKTSGGSAKTRETYTKRLAIGNADSAETTGLLALHRRFVCDLTKR